METMSLNATVRTEFGKGAARKIRKGGDLPAVVYRGGTEALPVIISTDELEAIFRQTGNRNTLIKLDTGDSDRICMVKAVERHPLSQRIRHVDFYQLDLKEEVEVTIKVVTTGEAKGEELGGRVRIIRRELIVVCKATDIPDSVVIDVTELEVDDILRISQIAAPKGCKFVANLDFNVVTVVGKRMEEEIELEDEEGETDGEGEDDAENEEG
jgi:large subunit ribosomal protein L25